jgi:hypothetical protein
MYQIGVIIDTGYKYPFASTGWIAGASYRRRRRRSSAAETFRPTVATIIANAQAFISLDITGGVQIHIVLVAVSF